MKSVRSLFAAIALMAIAVSCGKEPAQPENKMGAVTGTAIHISCRNLRES